MYKHAALSPAIQALQQTPTAEAAKQSFEQQLAEQAYSTFAVKFPDLVESIVTFKTLDSDADAGTAFGAFILDLAGESVYVPAVFADSTLSPLEIMYVKSKDMFVPFSPEWIDETVRTADRALGEASTLPETVPTDVDIRNLVVPPNTGRYSYASSGKFATEAAWTAAAGKSIVKLANEQFDPTMWEGFIEQFSRMNGVTPGTALDQGQMGIDELAKLYKSHAKTWGPQAPQQAAGGTMAPQGGAPQSPAPAPAMPQGMPSSAAPPAQAPQMYPKTANLLSPQAVPKGFFQSIAPSADNITGKLLEGAAVGGLLGAGTGVYEGDYRNLGSRMAQGAAGGALFGTAGNLIGHGLNAKHPKLTGGYADEVGQLLGTVGGGVSAALPDSPQDQGMYRYASAERDVLLMVKHAAAQVSDRPLKLIPYLHNAPNTVKTALLQVFTENPKVLKFAAETYGAQELIDAMRIKKVAGRTETSPTGLRVAKKNSETKVFGKRAPQAFRGVQLRGYYYEDGKKPKNRAVIKQEYHDTTDIREPGVFNLWKTDGSRLPVFALVNPISVLGSDRDTYPHHTDGVTHVSSRNSGLGEMESSHRVAHLLVMKDGKYDRPCTIHGEQLTESALEGGKVYPSLFTDKAAPPKSGLGFFFYKIGARYYGTEPVQLNKVSTGSDGIITGELCYPNSTYCSKTLRMDPKAPGSRIIRPRGERFVSVPATWRWVPLTGEYKDDDILHTASAVIDLGMNALGSTNIKVRDAGTEKAAALKDLADTYEISGADAEAILKIAELTGKCEALIVPHGAIERSAKIASVVEQAFSEVLQGLGSQMENIQGQMQVLQTVQQRAQELAQDPNAMQATDPAMAGAPQPGAPAEAGAPQPGAPVEGDPNAAAAAGTPPAAPQGAPQGAPQAAPPALPPGMDPNAVAPPQDPNAAAPQAPAMQDPAMQDPAMQGGAAEMQIDPNTGAPMEPAPPPLPVMGSEGPSSMEIAQQVNPEFLEQAAGMQDAGVFDVGVLSELERAAGRVGVPNAAPLTENSRDLAETVDDLGRTLLMLQLRQVDLQEQLSSDSYKELEQQTRNTFQGLGKLMLDLHQHSSALSHVQDSNAS